MTPAIAFWRHQPVLDQKAQSLAEATLKFHDAVGGDLVKLTPAGTYQSCALGLKDQWDGDFLGRRTITFRPINKVDDWLDLEVSELGQPEINCLQASEWLKSRLSYTTPLLATVFSPLSQAIQLAGIEPLTIQAQRAPDMVRQGIDLIAQRTIRLIDAYRKVGVSGIYYVSQHHMIDTLPSLDLHSWGQGADNLIFKASEGFKQNIMHFHGSPLIAQLPLPPAGWQIHFELTPGNNKLMASISKRDEPQIICIPFDTLRRGIDIEFRQNTISQLGAQQFRRKALIGAPCVLPLDIPLDLAAAWVKTAKAI